MAKILRTDKVGPSGPGMGNFSNSLVPGVEGGGK